MAEKLECMGNPEYCVGPVEYHSIDPGRERAWPRCEYHWGVRLDQRETSMERYANSDVEPDWFDALAVGESFNEDE